MVPPQYAVAATDDLFKKKLSRQEKIDLEIFGKENWSITGEFGTNILIERELDEPDKRFYNVAVAASITGYVRAYLFRAIKNCSGLLYCDTDSLAFTGKHSLAVGNDLGAWDHELRLAHDS